MNNKSVKIKIILVACVLAIANLVSAQKLDFTKSGVEPREYQIPYESSESMKSLNANKSIQFDENDVLSNPNASLEAVALYRYLQDMFGKKSLAGQQWVQWGINEMNYLEENTGKLPAVAGFDYINESQNAVENQRAIDHWNDGGIVSIMYHQGAPSIGEGYDNSKETIDIGQVFIEGTPEYIDFWDDLERIGNHLQALENANVPVLWRPFHELTGNWFWWSKEGPDKFKQLWIAMYDYLVIDRELDNLIWVLCYADTPKSPYFPGAEYVDIAGADTYSNQTHAHYSSMYHAVNNSVDGNNYPVVLHENGNPPYPQESIKDGVTFSWWMIWHTDWLNGVSDQSAILSHVIDVYNSDLVITLDEIPDIVETYGWSQDCQSSQISPSIILNDGAVYEINNIGIDDGHTQVTLQVSTDDTGIWNWSGYGLTENSDLTATSQQITINGLGTTTVQFTNECGALTTQTFNVVNGNETSVPLAVSDNLENDIFSIYPSPASQDLNLKFSSQPGTNGIFVKLLDLNGVVLYEANITSDNHTIDISSLSSGIYGVVAQSDEYSIVHKFLKR